MKYGELKKRIRAKFSTMDEFASALGVSNCTLSLKINGKSEWKSSEIKKVVDLLEIEKENINSYFFS